jgi:D-alanyl-lipoteichoic acid acyltransferase DltB (MBOAT superfamily)
MLPVGISFYTFISLGYMIDLYRGQIAREKDFIRFAVFISFFTQISAGPIERAGNLIPQITQKPKITCQHISDGLSLFITGLFKKIAIADYLAIYVNKIYTAPSMFGGTHLLVATFAFAWQVYFDFSGYTDMARGIARAMGYDIILNFNNPYLATGLGDFWKRWHISLSSWFKDYVYIPMGGNRKGKFNTYRNMFLTMVISGLWHGASWTFVIWGALHGAGRIVTRELENTKFYLEKIPRIIKQILVFIFVGFAWIFFRAESLSDAVLIIKKIFTSGYTNPDFPYLALFFCFAVWVYQFIYESRARKILDNSIFKTCLVCIMIFYLCLKGSANEQPFIYFQF